MAERESEADDAIRARGLSAAYEMRLARRVQTRLLPAACHRIDGLECAGICLQQRGVGGDFYDLIEVAPGTVALVVGDVSGKGVPAALMMATIQASLRTHYALGAGSLAERLEFVNRLFIRCTATEHYASLFVAEYDEDSARLRYASCGHVPPVLLRAGLEVELLRPTAMVLGLFEDWHCATVETPFRRGDLLLVASDGVTEAEGVAGESWGEDRLVETVQAHRGLRSAALVRAVADEVRAFCDDAATDDLTLLAARVRRGPHGAGSRAEGSV